MARIELAPEVAADLDRIFDHLINHEAAHTPARIDEIVQAISVLETNPLIGRPARNKLRELIIGRRSQGYVAPYRFIPEIDIVLVLAVRSQREAGYR